MDNLREWNIPLTDVTRSIVLPADSIGFADKYRVLHQPHEVPTQATPDSIKLNRVPVMTFLITDRLGMLQ